MPRPTALSICNGQERPRSKSSCVYQRKIDALLQEEDVNWEEVLKYSVVDSVNLNRTDPDTLLTTAHRAAYAGQASVLSRCIETGADVNARTNIGRSALHYACDGNHSDCIRLLLDHGADANLCTLSSQTPLHICCTWDHEEAALELLRTTAQSINVDVRSGCDSKLPEDLTKRETILDAIREYRNNLDEHKKAQMIEQAVLRLFCVFDRNSTSYVMPEEWAESQTLLMQHLSPANCSQRSEEAFLAAEQRFDVGVSWAEFRQAHLALIQGFGGNLKYNSLMQKLNSLETQFFQVALRIDQGQDLELSERFLTPSAQKMAIRRAQITLPSPKRQRPRSGGMLL